MVDSSTTPSSSLAQMATYGNSLDLNQTSVLSDNGLSGSNDNNLVKTAINTNDLVARQGNSLNETFLSNVTTGDNSHPTQSEEFSFNLFGNVLYPMRWLTLTTLTAWLGPISSVAMVVGCVLPYVPQYATIHKAQSSAGFSTFVCLTLLVSNILRIAFWFGHRFELPLLIQSIIQVMVQIALLELCVRVKKSFARRTIWSSHPKFFWRWTNLASYLEFIILFSLILGGSVYLLIDCKLFIETLGYCALVSESMLGLPQVIKNFRKKSVEGMSLSMVLMWLGGDTFKTGYFIANAVPYQFWLCGLLQISIDIIILIQVCLYRRGAHTKQSASSREMVTI